MEALVLLCSGFLELRRVGTSLHCAARVSHCGGFAGSGAQAQGTQASVTAAQGMGAGGGLSNRGAQA